MGIETRVTWADITWNPWQGCHKVSTECANCYTFYEPSEWLDRIDFGDSHAD